MNLEHVAIVKKGVDAIKRWRKRHPHDHFDLSSANLTDADLRGADLRGALFGGADLSNADLRRANLTDADLSNATLRHATFYESTLDNTELTRATLFCTAFLNIDLSAAKGLEATDVHGPCPIDIDTIYRSQGKIPESFLVECGVPDALIKFMPSLVGAQEPIQFYSCFISYSTRDQAFCKRLHSRMRDEHLRVWFAPEDVKAGRKLHEQIDEAIRVYDKLLLVLSEASVKSEWVKTEIHRARQKEKDGKRVLFPIRLVPFDAIEKWRAPYGSEPKDMADEIREYFIPDFSNWKEHDAFEKAFEKLLEALRVSA